MGYRGNELQPSWIENTDHFDFPASAAQIRHAVYVKGDGPPILILQELPGIGEETFALADRLIAAGFRVYLPLLIGVMGEKIDGLLNNARRLWCIRREFQVFRVGRQSEIANWMRALCEEIRIRENGSRAGLIGMCLTGSFVIPLMAEDAVAGAVASQPSLPFKFRTKRLHMSEAEVDCAVRAMRDKGPALAMRYKSDNISTGAHLQPLQTAFGDTLTVKEYDNPGNERGPFHSLLTLHFMQDAYDRTEEYFKMRFGLS